MKSSGWSAESCWKRHEDDKAGVVGDAAHGAVDLLPGELHGGGGSGDDLRVRDNNYYPYSEAKDDQVSGFSIHGQERKFANPLLFQGGLRERRRQRNPRTKKRRRNLSSTGQSFRRGASARAISHRVGVRQKSNEHFLNGGLFKVLVISIAAATLTVATRTGRPSVTAPRSSQTTQIPGKWGEMPMS